MSGPGLGDLFLTAPNKEIDRQQRKTFPGMAHFAGTGPDGKCCKDCLHWYTLSRGGNKIHDTRTDRPCWKYKRMTDDKVDRRIMPGASACKYFEPWP